MMRSVIPAEWVRPRWRAMLAALAGLFLSAVAATAQSAQPVPGEVSISTANGFARMLFRFRREVQAELQLTGSILIINFKEPVDIDVDRLNATAPDYISAARRDPDGMAVRIALSRKAKPNLMPAGEKLFLDLLPSDWKGLNPGLPQEVVNELARRMREAEKKAHIEQQLSKLNKVPPIRVQVAKQPTFIRYTFPLNGTVAIASDRSGDGLTVVFDAPMRFDLADAVAMLPSFVGGVESKLDEDASAVHFTFAGKVDVRTFREDSNYVVDVSPTVVSQSRSDPIAKLLSEKQRPGAPAKMAAVIEAHAPETVPAAAAPPAEAPAPARAPPPPAPPRAVAAPSLPPAPARLATAPQPAAAEREPVKPHAEAARPEPAAPLPAKPQAAATPAAAAPAAKPPVDKPPVAAASAATPAAAKPAVTAKPAAKPAATNKPAGAAPAAKGKRVRVEVKRQDDSVRLFFPFAAPTPAAVFRRADVMWVIFDSDADLDLDAVQPDPKALIRGMTSAHDDGLVLRLKLDRPRLSSLMMEGSGWALTIADEVATPSEPILFSRSVAGPNRASVIIPFEHGNRLHRLTDPELGGVLLAVTALGPVRGVLKPHDFVEFHALATTQGIAVEPLADDLLVQIAPERVVIGRPGGLTLSSHVANFSRSSGGSPTMFDIQQWNRDRDSNFIARQAELMNAAVAAPPAQQTAVHLNLARFYLARGMYFEAKGAMDMAIASERAKTGEAGNYVVRAVANLMIDRPVDGLKDLSNSAVGNQHDAPLWRALAYAEQHKWVEARAGFQNAQMSIGTLPLELQRSVLMESVRAAIEVGDFEAAGNQLNDFETIGTPPDLKPALGVLRGRVAEKLGRFGDAVADYESVTGSTDVRSATQARLRLAVVRMGTGALKRDDAIAELETVSVIWRGDQTEIEALQMLAQLYGQAGRVRDALGVMRSALTANARSDVTRHIQDEAAATFEQLFLSGKGEALPAIDALSLFYDFRDLTPMGRRGDEMIRRLADRLVSVDLLDQAAELLQHQVDHRLEGAARAQVAARLAMVYLMNHKPDRALATLRSTHVTGLSNTMRNRRLLLEARALSDLHRPDVALEIIANIQGREANRLRADVLWKASRWRLAGEQIERLLGNRWRDWQQLDALERTDVLRAAVAYALAEDSIGLGRLRERYVAKMTDGPDSRAFEVVTGPTGTHSADFRSVASIIGSGDTLDAFLHDMRAGFPDLGGGRPLSDGDAKATPPATVVPTSGEAPAAVPAASAKPAT